MRIAYMNSIKDFLVVVSVNITSSSASLLRPSYALLNPYMKYRYVVVFHVTFYTRLLVVN